MTICLDPPERSTTKPTLSAREIEVLRAWVLSDSKNEVGAKLFISDSTVNTHIARIRAKYESAGRPASTKATLLARAIQDGHMDLHEV